MTESLYRAWNAKARQISLGTIPAWKQCREVTEMLEHVRAEHANVYLQKCIEKGMTIEQIQEYASRVDAVGQASPFVFVVNGQDISASPTCLRYLFHALCIVADLETDPIVEIGGGYGGLAIAIDTVAKLKNVSISKYTILDLPDVQTLQKFYIGHFQLQFPVFYASVMNEPSYVISNYALSEMGDIFRRNYMTMIKQHARKGFLLWNSKASMQDLKDFQMRVEEENPQTGKINKVIQFTR